MPNNERRPFPLRWALLVVICMAILATVGWHLSHSGGHNKHEDAKPAPAVSINYNGTAAHLYGHVQVTPQPGGGLITIALTPERTVTLQVISSPTAAELMPARISENRIRSYELVMAQPVAANVDALQAAIPPGFYLVDVNLDAGTFDDDLTVYFTFKKGDPHASFGEVFNQPMATVVGIFKWPH